MNKSGPIIIIDDDIDDQFLMQEVFDKLHFENEILFFSDGEKAISFFERTEKSPFLIISDINLPKMTGLELKEKLSVNTPPRFSFVPWIFFTTSASSILLSNAYRSSVQGFFKKPSSLDELEKIIFAIIVYWTYCEIPTDMKY